jgi:hypothetical protein
MTGLSAFSTELRPNQEGKQMSTINNPDFKKRVEELVLNSAFNLIPEFEEMVKENFKLVKIIPWESK